MRNVPFAVVIALAVASSAAAGPRAIDSIRFDSPVVLDFDTLGEQIPVAPGDAADPSRIDRAESWLLEKGIFRSVESRLVESTEGSILVFELDPIPVVTAVDVRGVPPEWREEIRRRSRLREGDLLSERARERAVAQIERHARTSGYPKAVAVVRATTPVPDQARVTVEVTLGTPRRLASLEVEPPVGTEVLERRPGDVWPESALEEGQRALVRWYRTRGIHDRPHFEARVHASQEVREDGVHVRYRAEPGPPYVVTFEGNEVLSAREIWALLDVTTRPVVTDGTWYELGKRIEAEYRSRGHYFVAVDFEIDHGEEKELRYSIVEGERLSIRSVRFHGNEVISDQTLRELVETRARTFDWRRPGILLDDVLAEDVDRIASLYREKGFPDGRVVRLKFASETLPTGVGIDFWIDEGAEEVISRVAISVEEGRVPKEMPRPRLQTGDRANLRRLEDERLRIRDALQELGYPDASVKVRRALVADEGPRRLVDVVFDVKTGERVRIGTLRVGGNLFTRDEFILRASGLRPGMWLRRSLIADAQAEIYRTGLFRSVTIQASEDSGEERSVWIQVRERPGGEVRLGFGYDTRIGMRSSVELVQRNVDGYGRRASIRGTLNFDPEDLTPDEWLLLAGIREPFVLGAPFDARGDVSFQRSTRSIDEFSIRRFAVSSGIEKRYYDLLTLSLILELDDSRVFDVAPDAVLTGQDVGQLRTVSLNPTLVLDRRDDPFSTREGTFDTLRFRYGSPALGSDVHFAKVTGRHTHYLQLPADTSFLYSLRMGFAEPLGTSATIPIRERFFLGGRTSVRGFAENSIGPLGAEGNPTGGDTVASSNFEIQLPLVGDLRWAAFFDAGAVILRSRGASLDDVREAAGAGLRYRTPIGSISLDYGRKLDRRAGESPGEFYFAIGNIF